jgi:predicted membrane-bound mannosyltransferase
MTHPFHGPAIIVGMLTLFGATAVTFMMVMYALERRHPGFVLAFACGCALSSVYGFLAGTWPFGVVEAIWAAVAVHRYMEHRRQSQRPPAPY